MNPGTDFWTHDEIIEVHEMYTKKMEWNSMQKSYADAS